MTKNIPFLISGILIGIILFQSVCIAPAINQLIDAKQASVFLRHIWPSFFLIIGILSFLSFALILRWHRQQAKPKYFALFSAVLMTICFLMIPTINNARDIDNQTLWTVLHLCTVLFTFITLVLHSLSIFYWKFK